MSWAITAVVTLLGAIGGGAGMFAIASACVKWYRITSFEGAAGYFVVGLALAGFIVGLLLALAGARLGFGMLGQEWGAWGSQLGGGLGLVALALLVTLGIAYFKADHSRELGGRGLVVAWEVRLPEGAVGGEFGPAKPPTEWPSEELKLQLVSVHRDKAIGYENAVFDRDAFRIEDGQWILPARVPLFTSRGKFCVNLTLGGRDDGFWPSLTAFPTQGGPEFQWSPWYRTNKGMSKPSDREAVMYRFKFEKSA